MPVIFTASIRYVASNRNGRDFAVGDIHGCFTALQQSLVSIGFDTNVDRLFAMGDLIDRGPESHQATTWLDYPWFQSVCGNHEFMAIKSATNDLDNQSAHIKYGGSWLYALPVEERLRIATQLNSLPVVIEVETPYGAVGLIHADCPYDDWAGIRSTNWSALTDTDLTLETCLWSIERYRRKYTGLVRNVRAVVHGHMTVQKADRLGNVFYIDTGGWKSDGKFSFLNLHTLDIIAGPSGLTRRVSHRYR